MSAEDHRSEWIYFLCGCILPKTQSSEMGAKHSKPRLKRRMSSRGRRENPEGRPSSDAEAQKINDSACKSSCPCHKTKIIAEEKPPNNGMQDVDTTMRKQSEVHQDRGLRVSLPHEESNHSTELQSIGKDAKKSEWLLTLPRDLNDQSRNEKLSRLMDSICDVVGSEMKQYAPTTSKVRVRLSMTPEPRSQRQIGREDCNSQQTPVRWRRRNSNTSPTGFVTSKSQQKSSSEVQTEKENLDRRRHYHHIPGGEAAECSSGLLKPSTNESDASPSRGASHSPSRSRDRHDGHRCRKHHPRHSKRSRLKGGGYQSPYDQKFQEAMYIRLTELQRTSSRHRRRAGVERTLDLESSSDSDNVVAAKEDAFDSEYSGDDDNCVVGGKADNQCSRMFEPLSKLRLLNEHETASDVNLLASTSAVGHPHNVDLSQCSDCQRAKQVVKPWDSSQNKPETAKRKTLKKRRSSGGGGKAAHGYLRANAIGNGGLFPVTPKAPTKPNVGTEVKSPTVVQRHEHHHHHHYYYHKCDT